MKIGTCIHWNKKMKVCISPFKCNHLKDGSCRTQGKLMQHDITDKSSRVKIKNKFYSIGDM